MSVAAAGLGWGVAGGGGVSHWLGLGLSLGLAGGLGQPAHQTGLEATLALKLGVWLGQVTNPPRIADLAAWRASPKLQLWRDFCGLYQFSNKTGAWLSC